MIINPTKSKHCINEVVLRFSVNAGFYINFGGDKYA